ELAPGRAQPWRLTPASQAFEQSASRHIEAGPRFSGAGLAGISLPARAVSYITKYEGRVEFRWNDWNLEHVGEHGITADEVEEALFTVAPPYPLRRADDKWLVWGRGRGGRLIQVFILDDDDTVFVIHARPLTERERRRYRGRMK